MRPRNPRPRRPVPGPRAAFTLFEVAISLLVMAIAVLSALLFFPAGIKAQEQARFRAYAAVKALEIMDRISYSRRTMFRQRTEDRRIWNTVINHATFRPDLENEATHPQNGRPLIPLPMDLARRIDSDGDEIKRVLDLGGVLFVSNNVSTLRRTDTESQLPNEATRLVFAFVGWPQQNALNHHPALAWPYYDFYPSPPALGPAGNIDFGNWEERCWRFNAWPGKTEFDALCAHLANGVGKGIKDLDLVGVQTYALKAAELWAAVNGGMAPFDPLTTAPDAMAAQPPTLPEPYRVNALRYLAHAAVWLTKDDFTPTPDILEHARNAHEISLRWAMAYAAARPYDWGAPRPLNRPVMTDLPLLQHDLFGPAIPAARPALGPRWRIIAPSAPTGYGVASVTRVTTTVPSEEQTTRDHLLDSWGDHARFNLCARFAPAERCRELVVWAVDWQAWEDFEEAPSVLPDSSAVSYDPYGLMWRRDRDEHAANEPRVWTDAGRTVAAGNAYITGAPPTVRAAQLRGEWGADRNANGRLDRGALPRSVRQRAVTIARFNLYDTRVPRGFRY